MVGTGVGAPGPKLGERVGGIEGEAVGTRVGLNEGNLVGSRLGMPGVGNMVGLPGKFVGVALVGMSVCLAVGLKVFLPIFVGRDVNVGRGLIVGPFVG